MFDVAVINELKTNKECNSKDCVVRRKVCVTLKMKISSNDCLFPVRMRKGQE